MEEKVLRLLQRKIKIDKTVDLDGTSCWIISTARITEEEYDLLDNYLKKKYEEDKKGE